MTQLTFGYSDSEDRIWLRFSSDSTQVWLTRRLAGSLVFHLIEKMTLSCPGAAAEVSLGAQQRIALEHEMAGEVAQESGANAGAAAAAAGQALAYPAATESVLLTMFKMTIDAQTIVVECVAPGYSRSITMSRAEAHRFLSALVSRCEGANWALAGVPSWLTRPAA